MTLDPSPLTRLLRLEQAMEQLMATSLPETLQKPVGRQPASRSIWPADELLLTRLLRRSPEALRAYQGHAELTATEKQGLRLNQSATSSIFQFCELSDGDAVVWIEINPPDWIWQSESLRLLYDYPWSLDNPAQLVLHALPLFKPVSRGQSWSLHRRGEMLLQARPFPEQADQARLLRRLETLERRFSQQTVRLETDLQALRVQLRVQQDQIERMLKLRIGEQSKRP